jgi:hypothetical protein
MREVVDPPLACDVALAPTEYIRVRRRQEGTVALYLLSQQIANKKIKKKKKKKKRTEPETFFNQQKSKTGI